MRVRKLALRMALSLAVVVLALLILELFFRIKEYCANSVTLQEAIQGAEIPAPGQEITLRELYRINPDRRIVYEMRPNLDALLFEVPVRINASGFRGKEYAKEKPPGTLRIVGIGDSVMFGWKVKEEETYMHLLEERLNESEPGVRWQVINTAVPGYNTVMEVEVLKKKGLAYDPDLVLIEYVGNDLRLPNFLNIPNRLLDFSRSYLYDWILERLERKAPRMPFDPLQYVPSKKSKPEQVPAEYRDMMGVTPFLNAMKELKDLSREHDFALLVFSIHNVHDELRNLLKELGIPLLVLWPDISDYMSAHGISKYSNSVMTVGETDPHPSPITHDLVASGLLRIIMNGDPCILNAEVLASRREKSSTAGE